MKNGETPIEDRELFGYLEKRQQIGVHRGNEVFVRRITLEEQVQLENTLAREAKKKTEPEPAESTTPAEEDAAPEAESNPEEEEEAFDAEINGEE